MNFNWKLKLFDAASETYLQKNNGRYQCGGKAERQEPARITNSQTWGTGFELGEAIPLRMSIIQQPYSSQEPNGNVIALITYIQSI
jgi:hypothetical protein